MKKLLATLLVGAVSAASVFSLTACFGSENGGNTPDGETVTAEEWGMALTILTDGKHSFEIVGDSHNKYDDGTDISMINYITYDYTNNISSIINYDKEDNELAHEEHYWRNGDKYYVYYKSGDEDAIKAELDKATFEEDSSIYWLASIFVECDYEKATYVAEKKEYHQLIEYSETVGGSLDYTLKFNKGKLIECTYIATHEYGFEKAIYKFEYDNVKGKVPQSILDMEVNGTW